MKQPLKGPHHFTGITRDVTSESDQVAWLRPADALAAVESGATLMLPPTYLTCADLTPYGDVAAALAAAADREIPVIMPTVRIENDLAYLENTILDRETP